LPAAEIFGEGIVVALEYNILEKWAAQLPDGEKMALSRLESKRLDENFWFLPKVDPLFLCLHTLAHLLLRRITLNAVIPPHRYENGFISTLARNMRES